MPDKNSNPILDPIPDMIADPFPHPIADGFSGPIHDPIPDAMPDPLSDAIPSAICPPIPDAVPHPIPEPITDAITKWTPDPIPDPFSNTKTRQRHRSWEGKHHGPAARQLLKGSTAPITHGLAFPTKYFVLHLKNKFVAIAYFEMAGCTRPNNKPIFK